MSRKYRLVLMIVSIAVLLLVGLTLTGSFAFAYEDFWFTAGLLLLVMLSLVDQPHFSKDSNVFVNAVTASLSLLLVNPNDRVGVFWTFLVVSLYLIVSSYSLMWLRKDKLSKEGKFLQIVSRINRQIGRPEILFSAFFLWGAVRQYTLTSNDLNALMWFWIVFMILNVPSLAKSIEGLFDKSSYENDADISGFIFGVQSGNLLLAKLPEKTDKNVRAFDFVGFKYTRNDTSHIGMVLDTYLLDQEHWARVLCSQEIEANCETELDAHSYRPGILYRIDNVSCSGYLDTFLGIVTDNSRIRAIRFTYSSRVPIEEGQLIELLVRNHRVVYQVIDAAVSSEVLESKNEASTIVAEAVQLGEWSVETGCFTLYGWVPSMNTPVFLVSAISKQPTLDKDEIVAGILPGTDYPLILDKRSAVSHHMAILGVTGTGKSLFTRNLIKELACDDLKVIIVDLTGEYITRFQDIGQVLSRDDADASFRCIEALAAENAKYPNQRVQSVIDENEKRLKVTFHNSIKSFLLGNENMAIFELPDIANKSSIFEYNRWFFWVLFQIAKTEKSFGKRVCVVLEEAHTIVPEFNSLGANDNASKAAVNSIAQIALQGRKYGIGLIVVAQRTANVSKTILTQCNSIIVFQEFDKTTSDFLSNYIGKDFLSVLPTLKFRRGIAMGKAFRSTAPMIFEVPVIEEVIFESMGKESGEDESLEIRGEDDSRLICDF